MYGKITDCGGLVMAAYARVKTLSERKAVANRDAWFDSKLASVADALMETAPRWYPKLYPQKTVERKRVSVFEATK